MAPPKSLPIRFRKAQFARKYVKPTQLFGKFNAIPTIKEHLLHRKPEHPFNAAGRGEAVRHGGVILGVAGVILGVGNHGGVILLPTPKSSYPHLPHTIVTPLGSLVPLQLLSIKVQIQIQITQKPSLHHLTPHLSHPTWLSQPTPVVHHIDTVAQLINGSTSEDQSIT